jgi:hypothetical protein
MVKTSQQERTMKKKPAIKLASVLMIAMLATPVMAKDEPPGCDPKEADCEPKKPDLLDGWSTGFAVVRPKQRTIKEASLVAGKVVVRSESKLENTIMFARNFYPTRSGSTNCNSIVDFMSCYGAMIGVGMNMSGGSEGRIVDFIGAGLTVGSGNYSKASWNIGVGVGRRFNQQVLAPGFKEGAAPPDGETQIRYKSVDSSASFAFFTVRW